MDVVGYTRTRCVHWDGGRRILQHRLCSSITRHCCGRIQPHNSGPYSSNAHEEILMRNPWAGGGTAEAGQVRSRQLYKAPHNHTTFLNGTPHSHHTKRCQFLLLKHPDGAECPKETRTVAGHRGHLSRLCAKKSRKNRPQYITGCPQL